MTKDEKVEALIDAASRSFECATQCAFMVGCNVEFALNASRDDAIRYCRIQLLKWFRGDSE